jgi:hypothetical protein
MHITHTIYSTSIYTSKSNTLIQTSQYPTHSFKLHNIHHMHTQHNIHRQNHKSIYTYKFKVNTCKYRQLVVPRITAGQASSEAIEEVVHDAVCRIVRRI